MIRDFKEFALKGNLVELAVAFVLGLAFAAVVTSLVDDVIMQLVAAIVGKPDFFDLTFSIGEGEIRYGAFLDCSGHVSHHRLCALPDRQGGSEGDARQGDRARLSALPVLDPRRRRHLRLLRQGRATGVVRRSAPLRAEGGLRGWAVPGWNRSDLLLL